eukprot:scaffold43409_cov48-Phaeocystis_antarctica.AAC.2
MRGGATRPKLTPTLTQVQAQAPALTRSRNRLSPNPNPNQVRRGARCARRNSRAGDEKPR